MHLAHPGSLASPTGDPLPAEVTRHVRESILANRATYVAEHAHCDRLPCSKCVEGAAAVNEFGRTVRAFIDGSRAFHAFIETSRAAHVLLSTTSAKMPARTRSLCARRHHARGSLRSGRTSARRSRRTTSRSSRASSPSGLADEWPHEPPGEAGRQLTGAPTSPAAWGISA
jgi:hypothetical protein